MFGLPIAATALLIVFGVLVVIVAAGLLLNLFVCKQEPVTVIATQPSVIDNAWVPKEELAAVPKEELAALYRRAARRDTPGNSESRPFPF